MYGNLLLRHVIILVYVGVVKVGPRNIYMYVDLIVPLLATRVVLCKGPFDWLTPGDLQWISARMRNHIMKKLSFY